MHEAQAEILRPRALRAKAAAVRARPARARASRRGAGDARRPGHRRGRSTAAVGRRPGGRRVHALSAAQRRPRPGNAARAARRGREHFARAGTLPRSQAPGRERGQVPRPGRAVDRRHLHGGRRALRLRQPAPVRDPRLPRGRAARHGAARGRAGGGSRAGARQSAAARGGTNAKSALRVPRQAQGRRGAARRRARQRDGVRRAARGDRNPAGHHRSRARRAHGRAATAPARERHDRHGGRDVGDGRAARPVHRRP